jgi:similar to spore coat protein
MIDKIGVHESLELHELLTFKSLCLTKSTVMQALVTDPALKELMQEDVTASSRHIEDLKRHLA